MALLFLRFFFWFSGSSADHANTISRNCGDECARLAQNESGFLIDKRPMNTALNENKLARLNELTMILPREIRGQSQVLPRIIATVKRGELGLTKPGRPRGSFLLLGPTGVGKTDFRCRTIIPLRYVGISNAGIPRTIIGREAGGDRIFGSDARTCGGRIVAV
jgi:hypothetical protein